MVRNLITAERIGDNMAEEDAIMAGLAEATSDDNVAEPVVEAEAPVVEAEVTEAEEEVDAPASEDTDSEEEQTPDEATEEADESAEPDQKELARIAYETRQAEKAKRDAVVAKQQEEYLAEAQDQQDLALRQLQIDAYTNKVEMNVSKLQTGYDTALKDIDIFRNPTPEIAEYLSDALDEFQAKHVQLDELGNPIAVTGDINQFLSNKANLVQKLTQVGARNERVAKAKQSSAVTPTPTGSPKKPKTDPIMEGLLSEL